MKYLVAITLFAFFLHSEATQLDVCNQISQRILQVLKNESDNLTALNFTGGSFLYPVLNVTVKAIKNELAIDNQSIECSNRSADIINVTFNMYIRDFSVESDLSVVGYGRSKMTPAHVRTLAMGNVTLATQAFFAKKSQTLIVKNVATSYVEYLSDYDWSDTGADFATIRQDAETWVDTTMRVQFPETINFRVHKIIYVNTANITNGLQYYF